MFGIYNIFLNVIPICCHSRYTGTGCEAYPRIDGTDGGCNIVIFSMPKQLSPLKPSRRLHVVVISILHNPRPPSDPYCTNTKQ